MRNTLLIVGGLVGVVVSSMYGASHHNTCSSHVSKKRAPTHEVAAQVAGKKHCSKAHIDFSQRDQLWGGSLAEQIKPNLDLTSTAVVARLPYRVRDTHYLLYTNGQRLHQYILHGPQLGNVPNLNFCHGGALMVDDVVYYLLMRKKTGIDAQYLCTHGQAITSDAKGDMFRLLLSREQTPADFCKVRDHHLKDNNVPEAKLWAKRAAVWLIAREEPCCEPLYTLGTIYLQQKKIEKAVASFERIEIEGCRWDKPCGFLLMKCSHQLHASGHLEKAISFSEKAVSKLRAEGQPVVGAYNNLGFMLEQGDIVRAVNYYLAALKEDNNFVASLANLLFIAQQRGEEFYITPSCVLKEVAERFLRISPRVDELKCYRTANPERFKIAEEHAKLLCARESEHD
jgi:tetratricopeptide (TPR) repeat protein